MLWFSGNTKLSSSYKKLFTSWQVVWKMMKTEKIQTELEVVRKKKGNVERIMTYVKNTNHFLSQYFCLFFMLPYVNCLVKFNSFTK